ncbi:MAG: alpha/beta hydrolase [Lentimicrobiaceae bacterium]|nr:alpha/beta hydrolase [Lentimicrobiaceae bacterium]
MKIILTILTVLLLTACSFNKLYLQPTKLPQIPPDKEEITITASTKNDTTLVVFQSKTFQPTFFNTKNDTLKHDFTIESVVFKSENGNSLNGWFIKPKNFTPTITLLHFHGNAGFLLSQFQAVAPLLKYGFQIFVFDYSGFGFSEGKATRRNVLIDGNSALTYLKSRDDVKNTKLVIYGQSLGGHLSAVVAQQREAEIDGLVIEGAFSSHKDISAVKAGFLGRMLVSEKYSAYKSIQTYKKPLLVIHSTEDKIIPFKMGQKIYNSANEPKEFYEIRKCHICGPTFYADSISAKIENMINLPNNPQ